MKRIVFVMIFLLLGFGLVSAHGETEVDYDFHHDGMMGSFYGGVFGMGAFGWAFMTLIIVALVFLIVWLVKQLQSKDKKRERRHRKK